MKKLFALLIAGTVTAGTVAMAADNSEHHRDWNRHHDWKNHQENQHQVMHREHEQQKRIHEGLKSGELTHKEARHLENREHHIAQMDRRMDRNGLSPDERRRMEATQNHESHAIYEQKHDAQTQTH